MRAFTFFIINIIISTICFAQEEEETSSSSGDSTEIYKREKFFSGFSVTADIGKLASTQIVDFEEKWAFSGHLLFLEKYQISAELGNSSISPQSAFENVAYNSNGDFFRVGLDYLIKINNNNNLSIGFRKSSASYQDEGTILIESESNLSNDFSRSFSRRNLNADWWEILLISETKLNKKSKAPEKRNIFDKFIDNIYYGLNIRYRFNLTYDIQSDDIIDTYTIPGYGRTIDNSTPAINLFVKYRIGL